MSILKMTSVSIVSISLMAAVPMVFAETPWDRDYKGTWDVSCTNADYFGGITVWVNNVPIYVKNDFAIPGVCVAGKGVRPDEQWLQDHFVRPIVNTCVKIGNFIDPDVDHAKGRQQACQDIADNLKQKVVSTMFTISPQPWDAFYTDYASVSIFGLYPVPLAFEDHQHFLNLNGTQSRTGPTVIGWNIDHKANGFTLRSLTPDKSFRLPNDVKVQCTGLVKGQLTKQFHRPYLNHVDVVNRDAVGGSCFTAKRSDANELGLVSSGILLVGGVKTELAGYRISKYNRLDRLRVDNEMSGLYF